MILRVLLAILAAAPAWADAPATKPSRDVDVVYAMAGGLQQRMRWDVASQFLRVDPPGDALYMLVDYRNNRMLLVRPAQHTVTQVTGSAPLPTTSGNNEWQRGDTERIANLPCTDWLTRNSTGQPVALCLTQDGVLLRAWAATGLLVQAETVRYQPADPAAFKIPPDYQLLGMDAGAP